MSGSEIRWPLHVAFKLALELMGLLGDVVERIEIAGSIRRQTSNTVGDIELVCTPKYLRQKDFFGHEVSAINLLDERFTTLLRYQLVQKRLNKNGSPIAWGVGGGDSRMRALIYRGVPVDVFIVLPDRQWAPTMLIRTGPGLANGVLVTQAGVKNREGNIGILPKGMMFHEGAVWQGSMKLDTPTERDVFEAVQLPYIPPHERSIQAYQLWAQRWAVRQLFEGCRSEVHGYQWAECRWKVEPSWNQTLVELNALVA